MIVKGRSAGWRRATSTIAPATPSCPTALSEAPVAESALRASVQAGDVITYMGVPSGAGVRAGIDRDRDSWLDRSEITLGFDPANPHSNPWQFNP